jgi:hypothetical protein
MIPTNIHPSWYESYWYGVPEIRRQHWQHWQGVSQRPIGRHYRIDPAVLAAGLLFAVLATAAVLLTLFGPAVPADGLYFVT